MDVNAGVSLTRHMAIETATIDTALKLLWIGASRFDWSLSFED
jgi:hypothetical protein